MKSVLNLKLKNLLTLSVVVALVTAGCAGHKPPPVTDLPGGGHGGGGGGGLGNGGQIGGGGGVGGNGTEGLTPSGYEEHTNHFGWNENTSQFAEQTVYFDFDSAVIKASESGKISTVASFLSANTKDAVKVEGHCDERGTEEYNRALGERRALAIREELIRLGIAPDRVDTISYGEDRPADPGHDEAAWRKNRRGMFDLLTPP